MSPSAARILRHMPFDNLTEGDEQAYFAMGITEDIVTDLSKISGLFVIARESSFKLTNESVEVRHVAEQLGVRYVLQGSVRRSDNTIRVTARLIDALSGRLIWAERYDREVSGTRAKTDAVDARILAQMGAALAPEPDQPVSAASRNLEELQVARTSLVKERRGPPKQAHGSRRASRALAVVLAGTNKVRSPHPPAQARSSKPSGALR